MQIFTRVAKSISIFFIYLFPMVVGAEWSVDFSRRADQMGRTSSKASSETKETDVSFVQNVFKNVVPTQEVVIINTQSGFVPDTVRVRQGTSYRLVVVNVNEKARNVSFVLDSFSEHHATFYGEVKSFTVTPKKEGIYTFVSPETSARGRLVVHPRLQKGVNLRSPASKGN